MSSVSVCVFCGSRDGRDPAYLRAAAALGEAIARRGWTLVFGGGRVGLMGAAADAALAAGGTVTGIIPEALWEREVGHAGLSELLIVRTMHERKQAMADRADAFIALPGGFGTFEELFEVVTWAQLGFHRKPCIVLDVAGFWQPMLAMADWAAGEGFISGAHRGLLQRAETIDEALDLAVRGEAGAGAPPLPPDRR
ncbi:MAG: TIGR00730 family Rossman fold protein [Chloroflexota bacterium]